MNIPPFKKKKICKKIKNKNLLPVRNVINFLKHHAVCFFLQMYHFMVVKKKEPTSPLSLSLYDHFLKTQKCKQSVPIQNKLRTKCRLP